jgi:hypothetical protein
MMKKLFVMMSLALIFGVFSVQAQEQKHGTKNTSNIKEQTTTSSGVKAKKNTAAKTSVKPAENHQTKKTK